MAEAPVGLGSEYNPAITAKYYQLASELELSTRQTEANAKFAREQASASYQYGRGNLLRSEPQRIKANMNAANSQGLAESGQLAQAQSRTQGEYSQKQLGLSEQRAAAVKRANLGETQAKEREVAGETAGRKTALAEQNQYNIENPPPPAPTVATPSISSTTPSAPRKKAMLKYTGGYGKAPGYRNPGY